MLRFFAPSVHWGPSRHSTPSCDGHPLQRHKPADVVGKVLQADCQIAFKSDPFSRPHLRVILHTRIGGSSSGRVLAAPGATLKASAKHRSMTLPRKLWRRSTKKALTY